MAVSARGSSIDSAAAEHHTLPLLCQRYTPRLCIVHCTAASCTTHPGQGWRWHREATGRLWEVAGSRLTCSGIPGQSLSISGVSLPGSHTRSDPSHLRPQVAFVALDTVAETTLPALFNGQAEEPIACQKFSPGIPPNQSRKAKILTSIGAFLCHSP